MIHVSRWFILRTSGGQTLRLMLSLREAGFEVWTPSRPIRRVMFRGTKNERQDDIDVPILPTFVFARECGLEAIAEAMVSQPSPHPPFSIMRVAGLAAMIRDSSVQGLRDEEAREAATMQAIRDAETHEEAERIRIAGIRSASARRNAERASERERLNALRAQRCAVEPGAKVQVKDAPAFVGVTGVFEKVDGTYAYVRFGETSWKIEGWRVLPASSQTHQAPRGLAA